MSSDVISVLQEKCIRCSICTKVCPAQIVKISDDGFPRVPTSLSAGCIRCGHCEAYCPKKCLTVKTGYDAPFAHHVDVASCPSEQLAAAMRSRRTTRNFKQEPVLRSAIEDILDVVRYAPSGVNLQPVRWIVAYDTNELRRVTGLAVDWMREFLKSGQKSHPYLNFPRMIQAWENGEDILCRRAPHALFAVVPNDAMSGPTDALIALTHFDLLANASGIGTCWSGILLRVLSQATLAREALGVLPEEKIVYPIVFGYPSWESHSIPERKPLNSVWL